MSLFAWLRDKFLRAEGRDSHVLPSLPADLIRGHDTEGREVAVGRDDWRRSVLPRQLKAAWNDPDKLFAAILHACNDKFHDSPEVVEASERLVEIDPKPERSAVMRAAVLLRNGRADEAEKVLNGYSEHYGETALVLNNLAKVYAFRNEDERAESTLWRALRLNPNEDNTLQWLALIEKERSGEDAYWILIEKAASMPGSWRPQLFLGRRLLEQGDLTGAKKYYHDVLPTVSDREDAMRMISGDLGNKGHLNVMIDLLMPIYSPERHGPFVGLNLLRACSTSNRKAEGRKLLTRMFRQEWPAFRAELLKLQQEMLGD